MPNKEFMVSVADLWAYDESDNLILTGKTLVDSSIEVTLGNADIRGGQGNQLQHVYYHSSDMTINIMEAQFNLAYLASTIGSTLGTGANVYTEEDVTLTAGGAGTVTGTPLATLGQTTIYGWVTLTDGTVEKVTFTGSAFSCSGAENDVVCVRYYNLNAAAKEITIKSNIVPSVLKLVMSTQLASGDVASNIIGEVQIVVPKATLTGAFSLTMAADGVSQTPLNARALAFTPSSEAGCDIIAAYAYLKKILFNTNWYDDAIALAIVGGDITLASTTGTQQTVVKAIHSDGSVSTPPVADLTFSSDAVGTATYVAGLVTGVAAGTTTIRVTITAKTAIDAAVDVTVPA